MKAFEGKPYEVDVALEPDGDDDAAIIEQASPYWERMLLALDESPRLNFSFDGPGEHALYDALLLAVREHNDRLRYCSERDQYPCCECANKCDECNEHLSPEHVAYTMEYRDDVTCGKCIRSHADDAATYALLEHDERERCAQCGKTGDIGDDGYCSSFCAAGRREIA